MEELIITQVSQLSIIGLIIIIGVCIYALIKGATLLVDQAVLVSKSFKIPQVIIGATIVSLGTTLPEASVSVYASINGNPGLALGNAVGSIITDTGLIIGLIALISELPISDFIIDKEGNVQIIVGIGLVLITLPTKLLMGTGIIYQWMGIGLIIILGLYIYMSIQWSKNQHEMIVDDEIEKTSLLNKGIKIILGLFLVIMASKVLIPSVESIALKVGISESIIAATLIAFGTSLPELVTAVTATKKGHPSLALGNIIGADILNVLFVIGGATAMSSKGLIVPDGFYTLQFPFLIIILVLFRYFSKNKGKKIVLYEGAILLSVYIIYLILNFIII